MSKEAGLCSSLYRRLMIYLLCGIPGGKIKGGVEGLVPIVTLRTGVRF